MKKFNFLINFNLELSSLFYDKPDNSLSYDFIKKSSLEFSPKDHEALDAFVRELNDILDILFTIFNKPYIETKTNSIIKRSELVSTYSQDSFIKTIRDSSLRKQNKGQMKPELVHSIEYNDTFINYENIFIVFVFKKIIDLLNKVKEFNIQSTNSLSSFYGTKEASLSKLSVYRDLSEMRTEIGRYIFEDGQRNKNYELLIKIHSKVKHLKQHKFYLWLLNYDFKLPVNLTNTLLHDRRYNKVYRFYKDSLMVANTSENFDDLFYNYALIRFLNYLTENVSNLNMSSIKIKRNADSLIELSKPLKFNFNKFGYLLTSDPYKHEIYLKVTKLNREMNDVIKVIYAYNGEYIDSFGKDTLLIFTNNNLSNDYNNVVELNYDNDKNEDLMFRNTLLATQILIKVVNKEILKCPYCGSKDISHEGDDYRCLKCNGEFRHLKFYDTPYIWVKNLWRSN